MSLMLESLAQFVEDHRVAKACRNIVSAATATWGWVCDRTWPVYTTGVFVSTLYMLAAAQEKQILADHLYGSNAAFQNERDAVVEDARKLFQEESSRGVKQVVWMVPRAEFRREYDERHGKA